MRTTIARIPGPCPDWCTLPAGHSWDAQQPGGVNLRRHVSAVFGSDRLAHATVEADEYANETEIRPMVVVPHVDECADLDPFDADHLRAALDKALAFIVEQGFTRWWATAPNPDCRPWCQDEHPVDEFRSCGLFVCRAWFICDDVSELDSVEVNAATRCDDTPGSIGYVHDAPEIEVRLRHDSDGDWWSAEGFERAAAVTLPLLVKARRLAASDEYATDEQKAAAS